MHMIKKISYNLLFCAFSFNTLHAACISIEAEDIREKTPAGTISYKDFFAFDEGLHDRLLEFLKLKAYALSNLNNNDLNAAKDIAESLVVWHYLPQGLNRNQALTAAKKGIEDCKKELRSRKEINNLSTEEEEILNYLSYYLLAWKILKSK